MMHLRFALLPLCALGLAACAPTDLPEGGLSVSHPPGDGKCDGAPAQHLVGTKADQEIGFRILELTGSGELRWGGPDTAFTMDYREDRVNVTYDEYGIIERITCG